MTVLTPTNFETLTYNMPNWSAILNSNWQALNTDMARFNLLWDDTATDAIGIKYDATSGKWVASVFATAAQGALADSAVQPTDTINTLSDITSAGADIEDAVSKRHTQNTDTGTSAIEFSINTGGTPVPEIGRASCRERV